MKKIEPESVEWTQLVRLEPQERVFGLDEIVAWLKTENREFDIREGPQNTREIYVLAKPTEIRLAYSKELYKYQHPEVPGKEYSP